MLYQQYENTYPNLRFNHSKSLALIHPQVAAPAKIDIEIKTFPKKGFNSCQQSF